MILTSIWPSVISPDGHIEAMRPHQRVPCSKGEEGCVSPSGLGVKGGGGGSAVGTGRRRDPQAMWGGGGKSSWSVEMVEFLSYWLIRVRPKLPDRLIGARPRMGGLVILGRAQSCLTDWFGRAQGWEVWWFFSSFLRVLQLRVDKTNPLAVTQICYKMYISTFGRYTVYCCKQLTTHTWYSAIVYNNHVI